MKKTFIKRLATLMLFAITGANLFSQGFYVYTKDGQHQEYAAENVDSIVFYQNSGTLNGHAWVDLGLPSGLRWATCNVGASSPEEYGNYYAWGEIKTKSSYYESNSTTYVLAFSVLQLRGIIGPIGSDGNLTAAYDAATANWGDSWRMPTLNEMQELLNNCTLTWTTQNGVKGRKVTGPNGNSIFLPAAGYRKGTYLYSAGSYGGYWLATPYTVSYGAHSLLFLSDSYDYCYSDCRFIGLSVRPVSDELLNDSEK